MRSISITAVTAGGLLAMAGLACAETPVAVVEEVQGKPAGIEFMDYVGAGKVIKLGSRDRIVLGYLKSCWRETITGGTVTIGTEQSEVQRGTVERIRVKCDGGRMQLMTNQAVQSAGAISRAIDTVNKPATLPEPRFTIYGQSPIIELRGGGVLLVERVDQASERYQIAVGKPQLVRGSFFDFARANWLLASGGLYRATFGSNQITFKVDPAATAAAPVIARLVRF